MTEKKRGNNFYRWGSIFLISMGDLTVHFTRNSVSVMRTAILTDLPMTDTVFGTFSAIFTYAYLVFQLVVGALADRIGVRKVFMACCLISAGGAMALSFSNDIGLLFLGRALMGGGMAVPAMGLQKLVTGWFKNRWAATVIGFSCALGSMGAVLAQVPLASWLDMASWKTIYRFESFALILLAILVFFIMRDNPASCGRGLFGASALAPGQEKPSFKELLTVFKKTITNKRMWPAYIVQFVHLGLQCIFVSTWAVAYLEDSFSLTRTGAAEYTSVMLIGQLIMCGLVGIISDLLKSRKIVLIGLWIFQIISWVGFAFFGEFIFRTGILWPIMFMMGTTGAVVQMVHAYAREVGDPQYVGITVSLISALGMIGGALGPMLIGMLLDANKARGLSGLALYSETFIPCIIAAGICLFVMIFGMTETHGVNIYKEDSK